MAKDQDKDEAFQSAITLRKSNGKGKNQKLCGVCWNCGEKEHFKDKYLKPATDNKNDSSKPKASAANATIKSDSEGEGAFFIEPEPLDNCSDIPKPGAMSDLDEEPFEGGYSSDGGATDWFSEVDEKAESDWNMEELSRVNGSECSSSINVDLDLVSTSEPDEFAVQIGVGNIDLPQAEIYDSSCSKHLTPYHDALKNFVEIPPKSFRAANKQNIIATGMGKMIINIPDGTDVSQLRLTEVLCSLEVGYMLVSVGWLDEKGFELTFSGGKCTIKGPDSRHIGTIPKTKGLYQMAHNEPETAHTAVEELTLEQFHCQMGHISVGVTCHLVHNGFITGVRLESSSSENPFFCKSCVYAKATWKTIPKACEDRKSVV